MNIRVIDYSEGRFLISKDLNEETIRAEEVSIGISPVLKYRKGEDVVGALLNIDYSVNGSSILFLGMVVSVYVENIKDILGGTVVKDIKKELKPVWEIALGMARGVIAEKTRNTILKHHFLPIVDIDRFSEFAVLEEEKE